MIENKMAECQSEEMAIHEDIDLSMIITAQIIRLLHDARADKDVALSALGAAVSHIQCINRTATV